jgi:uncharacterized membrane protein
VTAYHWLLFFHLIGAFCFFAGAAIAGTLQIGAMRRERPSEILTLLRLTRVGVLVVVVGALMTIAFGSALASNVGYGFKPAWIQASYGLWLASVVLGGIGGRTARHARYRAEELAAAVPVMPSPGRIRGRRVISSTLVPCVARSTRSLDRSS